MLSDTMYKRPTSLPQAPWRAPTPPSTQSKTCMCKLHTAMNTVHGLAHVATIALVQFQCLHILRMHKKQSCQGYKVDHPTATASCAYAALGKLYLITVATIAHQYQSEPVHLSVGVPVSD